ncbi:hypothetical protein Pcinc_013745 [Petrolisthes cinctipes]|uniref:Ras-associating domain-containing protein n=1 Tax=Petrolisthes cinctipes TaxID=88211 RepID=A0AAE1FY05_PETCI|nr:hypothetical protein Pcinc_013745 [Petrolisthes cinctipes]
MLLTRGSLEWRQPQPWPLGRVTGVTPVTREKWCKDNYVLSFARPANYLQFKEDGFMVARMELKVWVEGIQRIVCGVTETTTCQDVVYALAHATGKTGRFTLIERWRNNERLLAPNEYPLKILLKWGEYSNDVQFILQRSALDPKTPNGACGSRTGGQQRVEPPSRPALAQGPPAAQDRPRQSPHTHKDLKKSLTFSGGHAELRRLEGGASPPALAAPLQPGPHHGHSGYHGSPTSSWEGQGWAGEGNMTIRSPGTAPWRPPAPPPYEVVRGNPPPPPPTSRIGVDNVRATTSHWGTARPSPHSPPSSVPQSTAGAVFSSPTRTTPTAEPPYSLARRDHRTDHKAAQRTEPVYSDGRRGPYPGYTHHSNLGPAPGNQYAPRGHPPSHASPEYNGPPPPKPPHILGPRELPPYRHPPPPTSSPTKISPSRGSPRKISGVLQPLSGVQLSPSKQLPPQPPPAQVPLPNNKVPNSHHAGSSPHSSPVRHPSPTRRPSPTRHPSPSRPCVANAPSPRNNAKIMRSASPVKTMQPRHGYEDVQGYSAHGKGNSRTYNEEGNVRLGEVNSARDDNVRTDVGKDVLNNSIGLSLDTTGKTNHHRSIIDGVSKDIGGILGRGVPSEVSTPGNDASQGNFSDHVTSLDTIQGNHLVKSPPSRRSPSKDSQIACENMRNNNKTEQVVVDNKYRDLVKLINLQREKLNNQQVEMTKCEAEIAYLEGRSREDESRLAYVLSEIERHEKLAQQIDQEVSHLQQLEQETENAREAEAKVKAELSALQAQLANCEEQLAARKQTVRSAQELEQSMSEEQKRGQEAAVAQQEAMVREIDKLHTAIAQATAQAQHAHGQSQQLQQEMAESETVISEKKKEVEKLVMEMKDANLESLSITPSEEIRALLEVGTTKPGSSRRMIGSPRQLENAVPTSKNPHGVWV